MGKNKLLNKVISATVQEYPGGLQKTVAELIKDKAAKYFTEVNDCQAFTPKIDNVTVQVAASDPRTGDKRGVAMSVSADVDYLTVVATRRVTAGALIPAPTDPNNTSHVKKELTVQLDIMVKQVLKSFFKNLPSSGPSSYNGDPAFQRYFSKFKYLNPSSIVSGTKGTTWKRFLDNIFDENKVLFTQKIRSVVQSSIEKKQAALGNLPQGFVLVSLMTLDVGCSISSKLEVTVKISGMMSGEQQRKWEYACPVFSLFNIVTCKDVSAVQMMLTTKFTNLVDQASSKLADTFPICEVVAPDKSNGFPHSVFNMIKNGSMSFGNLIVKDLSINNSSKDRFPLYFLGGKKYETRNVLSLEEGPCASVNLDLKDYRRKINTKYQLGRYHEIPLDTVDRIRFYTALSKDIAAAFAKKNMERPAISLSIKGKKIISLSCGGDHGGGKSFGIPEWDNLKVLSDKITKLCMGYQKTVLALFEVQKAALHELNPTEFEVLKHTVLQGRTWFHDVSDSIDYKVITTKTYAGDCLSALCQKKVPTVDGDRPLLQVQIARSMDHGEFNLYKPCAALVSGVLSASSPRDYLFSELSGLKAYKRGPWFTQKAMAASTPEDRWEALKGLENGMPKTFASEFAKSADGKKFFTSFTGADALYAKFFLEAIPGCKRLAATYFPEEE